MRSSSRSVVAPVEIDPVLRTARIQAGTRWREVIDTVTQYGLTALHEPVASRDAVRDLLRGGLSFHGRRHGLALSSVRAVELVLADGEIATVDAGSDPDLFWAVRGGGGGDAVRAVEISLFPAAAAFAGAAWWPLADAAAIVGAWRRWALEAPLQITTALRITPRGVCVDGAVLAGMAGESMAAVRIGHDLLNRLRAVATPSHDTWDLGSPGAVVRDPAGGPTKIGDHLLLRGFGDDEVIRAAEVLESVELRQLGGAFSAPDRSAQSVERAEHRFVYRGSGTPDALARVRRLLQPWTAPGRLG
jgi:FAD/FMN-containing dehydrogenase